MAAETSPVIDVTAFITQKVLGTVP